MRFIYILILLINYNLFAQFPAPNLVLVKDYSQSLEKDLYFSEKRVNTSFKPIIKSNLSEIFYSKFLENKELDHNYIKRVFTNGLFILKGQNYFVSVDPIFNFNFGREFIENKNLFINSRGYLVSGNIGDNLSFLTTFMENQAIFPNYVDSYISKNKIVPGQGYARDFKKNGFDYAIASGYFSLDFSKIFTMQFGHGKHFIGDGYRSLLLSDNSFNYPFLRIETKLGKLQYTNLYAELQDLRYFENNSIDNADQIGFAKKYMSTHYLDFNINKKMQLSLFESVIWRTNHAPGENGFDIQYLNPIIFLRPVEYSINSPDNMLLGLNLKYNVHSSSYAYSQLLLDEFVLDEIKNDKNFWGNKFGYQFGYKYYDFLTKNLTTQIEYNFVRPYTYAHQNPAQNYGHYNQSLAHPIGANFSEIILLNNYSFNRFSFNTKFIFIKYGGKILNDPISYGNDIFMSTGNFAELNSISNIGSGRPDDYNIKMYQGNLSVVNYQSISASYLLSKKTNLKCTIEVINRFFKNEDEKINSQVFNFGIMTDLFNNYYDY